MATPSKPNDEWSDFADGVTSRPHSQPVNEQSAPAAPAAPPAQTTIVCSRCGTANGADQKFCGTCGAALQPVIQANTYPSPPPVVPVVYVQPALVNPVLTKSKSNALLIEAIGAIFGLYGLGWFYVGQSDQGIKRLILGLVWGIGASVIAALTAGVFACVALPVDIVLIILLVNSLNGYIKANPQRFHE